MVAYTRLQFVAILAALQGAFAAPVVERDAPSYNDLGCFHDSVVSRSLTGPSQSVDNNTPDTCASFCADFKYFGVEWGRECYCGNTMASPIDTAAGECTKPCSGDATLTCGEGDRIEIYENLLYVAPTIKDVTGYTFKGCHEEIGGRAINGEPVFAGDDMCPQLCADHCRSGGFLYAALEFGRECYCGNTILGGKYVDNSQCAKVCAGEKDAFCGDADRLQVYGPAEVVVAAVDGATSLGCFPDVAGNRVLTGASTSSSDMTAAKCSTFCGPAVKYFGVEFGKECYCGADFSLTQTAPDGSCALPCAGDGTTICGDAAFINVYEKTITPVSTAPVGAFTYKGCGTDTPAARTLDGPHTASDDGMTPAVCAAFCADYDYFGLEFGKECFCGNTFTGSSVVESDCSTVCSGDSASLCGAPDRVSLYKLTPTEVACYTDSYDRLISDKVGSGSDYDTVEECAAYCDGYKYFGVEYGHECYCGNTLNDGPNPVSNDPGLCNYACEGNSAETCGGFWGISLYQAKH